MNLTKIDCYSLRLPLKSPFKTSYGELTEKACDILVITDDQGNQGYGELTALETPDYIEETLSGAQTTINQFLIPLLISHNITHPKEVSQIFASIKGNYMAKSALETAIWDLYAKQQNCSFKTLFNVKKEQLEVGVSLGIEPDFTKLVETVNYYHEQGYTRIKLKIRPGYDSEPLTAIRQAFPDLLLMADANSAYCLNQSEDLIRLDNLGLSMIEQPFSDRDYVGHARLQARMTTPICLDETIRSIEDLETAYTLGSCQSVNLKIPRVGGITPALDILNFCKSHDLMVWLGGMYESGVGRALNLAFAAQDYFTFPGDLSASDRYFFEDIITTPHVITNGKLPIPKGNGLGVELSQHALEKYGYHNVLWTK
ncbi:o-succinylbenzoate synthase [Vagococcus sp. PNs007]|uniref:o-succinylbenzoate synthase n=1 Tax=Vagococcus proximus TaxID=2991417 RepID=A0ABT5X038_9ENTE|nr:o-succinylbenzoate synthase [Vagococcus proximus]MDF0479369.1 o-succinylbenzoate synthase [Vagococcus proximus]